MRSYYIQLPHILMRSRDRTSLIRCRPGGSEQLVWTTDDNQPECLCLAPPDKLYGLWSDGTVRMLLPEEKTLGRVSLGKYANENPRYCALVCDGTNASAWVALPRGLYSFGFDGEKDFYWGLSADAPLTVVQGSSAPALLYYEYEKGTPPPTALLSVDGSMTVYRRWEGWRCCNPSSSPLQVCRFGYDSDGVRHVTIHPLPTNLITGDFLFPFCRRAYDAVATRVGEIGVGIIHVERESGELDLICVFENAGGQGNLVWAGATWNVLQVSVEERTVYIYAEVDGMPVVHFIGVEMGYINTSYVCNFHKQKANRILMALEMAHFINRQRKEGYFSMLLTDDKDAPYLPAYLTYPDKHPLRQALHAMGVDWIPKWVKFAFY